MKIVVTASPQNTHIAQSLMFRLETAGIETAGIRFNKSWRIEKRSKIDSALCGGTHLFCVVDESTSIEAWFAYVIGFALGHSMPVCLFRTNLDWDPEPWLENVKVLDSQELAASYYKAEYEEWAVKDKQRMAKASLLELGISWHSESLAQCVKDGDIKAVDLFIESGFPVNSRDKFGVPLLCLAARTKHKSLVELILDRDADINCQSDDRGYSALMDAAQTGDKELVSFLLGRGADPNLVSKDGQTALVLAVGRNDVETTRLLVKYSADPDISDKLGISARKYAKLFNNKEIISLIETA